jgi:hypothetical protein
LWRTSAGARVTAKASLIAGYLQASARSNPALRSVSELIRVTKRSRPRVVAGLSDAYSRCETSRAHTPGQSARCREPVANRDGLRGFCARLATGLAKRSLPCLKRRATLRQNRSGPILVQGGAPPRSRQLKRATLDFVRRGASQQIAP